MRKYLCVNDRVRHRRGWTGIVERIRGYGDGRIDMDVREDRDPLVVHCVTDLGSVERITTTPDLLTAAREALEQLQHIQTTVEPEPLTMPWPVIDKLEQAIEAAHGEESGIGRSVKARILAALQDLEEINGPGRREYVDTMRWLIVEATDRLAALGKSG